LSAACCLLQHALFVGRASVLRSQLFQGILRVHNAVSDILSPLMMNEWLLRVAVGPTPSV
jgi:hypothetical protein